MKIVVEERLSDSCRTESVFYIDEGASWPRVMSDLWTIVSLHVGYIIDTDTMDRVEGVFEEIVKERRERLGLGDEV